MSADYRVDVTIGPTASGQTYAWSVWKGDPPVLPVILDGLEVGWRFPDATLWPVQPEPAVAAFSIIAASASDLAGIDRGTPVVIRVWAGLVIQDEEQDSLRFVGRVSDLSGVPVTVTDPSTDTAILGWQLNLTCADLTADLGEPTVAGYIQLQGYSTNGHVEQTFRLAGLPLPNIGDGGRGSYLLIDSETQGLIEPTSLADSVEVLLSGYADGGAISGDPDVPTNHALYSAQGWRRGIVRPNLDDTTAAPFPEAPWRIEWVSRRYGARPFIGPSGPARFALLDSGLYGVRLEPPPPAIDIGGTLIPIEDVSIVIDAAYLQRQPAKWTRSKFDDPNEVTVTLDTARYPEFGGIDTWESATVSTRTTGEAVVGAQVPNSRLGRRRDAVAVAEMYADDSGNADVVWSAGGLTWLASEDPRWPLARSLFPDTPLFGEYGAPIVITGIPASQRPDGRPWYTGVPKSVSFKFERGKFAIDFELYPRIPRPIGDNGIALTWSDLKSDYPDVTWNDLDRGYTWLDYRLARTTTYDPS